MGKQFWKSFFNQQPKIVKVTEPPFNRHHPEMTDRTEFAFEAGGVNFYRFIDQYMMPTGRYKWLYAALREADLRMSREMLLEYIQSMKKAIKGEKNKIDLEQVWRTLFNMETRLALAFEPEGIKKLASITYFTEDEILSTWDPKEGKKKVELWNKSGTYDFFLSKPIGELLKLSDSSITSLETYLREISPILEELNSN